MMMIKKMIMIDNDNVYENNGYSDAFNVLLMTISMKIVMLMNMI